MNDIKNKFDDGGQLVVDQCVGTFKIVNECMIFTTICLSLNMKLAQCTSMLQFLLSCEHVIGSSCTARLISRELLK